MVISAKTDKISATIKPTLLQEYYSHIIEKSEDLSFNREQYEMLPQFEIVIKHVLSRRKFFNRIKSRLRKKLPQEHSSLYIFGEVGRGKSFVMQCFSDCYKNDFKIMRIHFHKFMADIHDKLNLERRNSQKTNRKLIEEAISKHFSWMEILCLDELQVTDITDAMILSSVFYELWKLGIAVVFTSNRSPDELYLGGLQREKFEEFVDLLKKQATLINLNHGSDYRYRLEANHSNYFLTSSPEDKKQLINILQESYGLENLFKEGISDINQTLKNAFSQKIMLENLGRELYFQSLPNNKNTLLANFDDLCRKSLGTSDYRQIALNFQDIFIINIQQMKPEDRNEARRFVHLIDELYNYNNRVFFISDVVAKELYPAGDGSFEFQRTISRIHELANKEVLISSITY